MNSNVCYTCIMYRCCFYIYMGDIFHIHMRTLDSPSIHPKGSWCSYYTYSYIFIHTYTYTLIHIIYVYIYTYEYT